MARSHAWQASAASCPTVLCAVGRALGCCHDAQFAPGLEQRFVGHLRHAHRPVARSPGPLASASPSHPSLRQVLLRATCKRVRRFTGLLWRSATRLAAEALRACGLSRFLTQRTVQEAVGSTLSRMSDSSGKRALATQATETREIVIPHAGDIQPVTAVKGLLLQSSLNQLQLAGHFDAYTRIANPTALKRLRHLLASEWAPLELAEAHYETCELLGLSDEEIANLGRRVGDRLQETSLVSTAKKTPTPVWSAVGALHRIWGRQYQGGSVQAVKLGPNECGFELCGFRLQRFRYCRLAQLSVLRATFEAVGAHVQSVRVASYSAAQDEVEIRIVWL